MQPSLEQEQQRARQYAWIQPESDCGMEVSEHEASGELDRAYVPRLISSDESRRTDGCDGSRRRDAEILEVLSEEREGWCRRGGSRPENGEVGHDTIIAPLFACPATSFDAYGRGIGKQEIPFLDDEMVFIEQVAGQIHGYVLH